MYYTQILMTAIHIQAGIVLRQDYVPKNSSLIEHNIPIYNSVFPGG